MKNHLQVEVSVGGQQQCRTDPARNVTQSHTMGLETDANDAFEGLCFFVSLSYLFTSL
jgi:hypothetical protein